MWTLRTICRCTILFLCQLCAHAYLVNKWSAQDWASGFFTNKCHVIPKNMTLCYGIGYDQMRLPNLLNHESVDEAVQQSNIWNLLDKTKCHDDLRVFLCSLYAPVCLKEGRERQIIKPCRSLCIMVRDNCLPRMRMFGYEWPAIADCAKFPDQTHLCIPPRQQQKELHTCKACDQAITFENIVSSYCMAKVVMKGKMRAFREDQSMFFIDIHRKRRYFRSTGLTSQQKKTILGRLKREEKCNCPSLGKAKRHDKFLIMGDRDPRTGLLDVMFITPWKRKNRHFKRATRAMRKKRELCRRQKFIDQHYTMNTRRQPLQQQRNFPPPVRRPDLDPMGLMRPVPRPLPNFNRDLTPQVEEPMFPRPPSKPIMGGKFDIQGPNRPTISSTRKPRKKQQRKKQRDNRKQRQGRKKKGRRRKDQRNSRKGRGRGKGNRNRNNRNRNNNGGKKKRKRKRKRKMKMRRHYFNQYHSMTS